MVPYLRIRNVQEIRASVFGLSVKECYISKMTGIFLTTYCVWYPNAVPFSRNEMPYSLLNSLRFFWRPWRFTFKVTFFTTFTANQQLLLFKSSNIVYNKHILWKDKIHSQYKNGNVNRKEFTSLSVTDSQRSDVAS